MKVIVGLGNPDKKYLKTRHNTGFMVLDLLLADLGINLDMEGFKSFYTIYRHNGEKVVIVKPQTYMNLSGEAVQEIMHYFKAGIEDLIVVHDDLDLPVGKIRLRKSGSSGGQKGMGNIIDLLGTSDIKRIRVGISNNKLMDTKDYVLGKITEEEKPAFTDSLVRAKDALKHFLDNDFDKTMNIYNKNEI